MTAMIGLNPTVAVFVLIHLRYQRVICSQFSLCRSLWGVGVDSSYIRNVESSEKSEVPGTRAERRLQEPVPPSMSERYFTLHKGFSLQQVIEGGTCLIGDQRRRYASREYNAYYDIAPSL